MTVIDRLTDNQRDIIVSLPYRVGLLVSQSDSGGGEAAQRQEAQALASILNGFAEEVFGAEIVHHIMTGTLKNRARWPEWGRDLRTVPEDCRKAVDILLAHVDEKDVNAFKNELIEIGEAVALAFRERGAGVPLLGRFTAFFAYQAYRARARKKGMTPSDFDAYVRISPAERKAIGAVASALGVSYT